MRIGLVIWSMFTLRGGIERVGAMLANEMTKRGQIADSQRESFHVFITKYYT